MTAPFRLRLHLIVRADLSLGSQLAQIVHGQDAFRDAFPAQHSAWHQDSNTVVIHHARDLAHLQDGIQMAQGMGLGYALFREEDLADQPTCMVLNPYHPGTTRLARDYPLAQ